MKQVGELSGRHYHLFDYVGAPDAEKVIIAMGSGCDTIEETINYLNARGEKLGLSRYTSTVPFSIKHFMAAIPASCKKIAVLDRTKEPGSLGRAAVSGCVLGAGRGRPHRHQGRRRTLWPGSKEFNPTMVKAVYG